jgi:hypothetical protein
VELLALDSWADAFYAASHTRSDGDSGFYPCLADEDAVWV